ncbi:hypothetical protein [Kitasatospora sp. NPDC088346]|uniref:hypothetical protein n=1 Tax=Kitasatospora sp. NPDC088346 TaxID=3364073 RepID=UPI00382331B2
MGQSVLLAGCDQAVRVVINTADQFSSEPRPSDHTQAEHLWAAAWLNLNRVTLRALGMWLGHSRHAPTDSGTTRFARRAIATATREFQASGQVRALPMAVPVRAQLAAVLATAHYVHQRS